VIKVLVTSNLTKESVVKHNNIPITPANITTKPIKIEAVVKKPAKIQKPFNASKTYLTAKIKSISPYGLVLVKFSENMQDVLT
jgi:hypothetical protein